MCQMNTDPMKSITGYLDVVGENFKSNQFNTMRTIYKCVPYGEINEKKNWTEWQIFETCFSNGTISRWTLTSKLSSLSWEQQHIVNTIRSLCCLHCYQFELDAIERIEFQHQSLWKHTIKQKNWAALITFLGNLKQILYLLRDAPFVWTKDSNISISWCGKHK